jgi:hypothetical protein
MVRVTETKDPCKAQAEISEFAGNWQIANKPGSRENFKE